MKEWIVSNLGIWGDIHGELVRCKDCKFSEKATKGFCFCKNRDLFEKDECVSGEWYCADGQRREEK